MESPFPKDPYLYMMNFADDRTILNMLSVNNKFNDPAFFQSIIERKYPGLIKFKKEYESWKNYYLRVIKFLSEIYKKNKIIWLGLIFQNNELEPDKINFYETEKDSIDILYNDYMNLITEKHKEIYNDLVQIEPISEEDIFKLDLNLTDDWKDKNIFANKLKDKGVNLKFDMNYARSDFEFYDFVLVKYIPS